MRILLTNDDGIHAQGIEIIYEILKELNHEVYIVAPDYQQSGVSHTITLRNPLLPSKIYKNNKFYGIAINGTPTDAVKFGISTYYKDKDIDIVISGINLGYNAGPSVYYSGTVAGAFEGMANGKIGIALSLDSFNEKDFIGFKEKIFNYIPKILKLCKNLNIVYNINFPKSEIKGIRFTRLFRGYFVDKYEKRKHPIGIDYYWLNNFSYTEEYIDNINNFTKYLNDIEALKKGYISITPLQFDLTHYKELENLELIHKDNLC